MKTTSLTASNKKIKKWVIIASLWYLTWQLIGLVGTVVFYLFASSVEYSSKINASVLKALYPKEQWDWLRGQRAVEVITLKWVSNSVLSNF